MEQEGKCKTTEDRGEHKKRASRQRREQRCYIARDLSLAAERLGITVPVVMTQLAWDTCIAIPDDCPPQNTSQLVADLLTTMRKAILKQAKGTDCRFTYFVKRCGAVARPVELKARCGTVGRLDDVVILILLAHED